MADVLVDTSAWIDYLRAGSGEVSDVVDMLLAEDRAVLCGVVEMELLQGVRPHERRELVDLLQALPYVETERVDFVAAGQRMAELRGKGITIPNSDCLIGILCVRHNLTLLTLDSHFDHLPEVPRQPANSVR
jgi:predicted nucleic acid-binding protein